MMTFRLILIISIIYTLSGCSVITPPTKKPVIEDHSGRLGTFATVAERRMVVTKKDYRKGYEGWFQKFFSGSYDSKFCAEPSPDATQSITSAITAALRGSASGLDAKPELSMQYANTLATTVQRLFHRSQGVQLFRDGLYNLCQAHLNGLISEDNYLEQFGKLVGVASKIIEKEIPDVLATRAENAADASETAQATAVNAKIAISALKAEIEGLANNARTVVTEATAAKDAAVAAKVSLDAAVKKAEAAAKKAEDAAN